MTFDLNFFIKLLKANMFKINISFTESRKTTEYSVAMDKLRQPLLGPLYKEQGSWRQLIYKGGGSNQGAGCGRGRGGKKEGRLHHPITYFGKPKIMSGK